MRPTPRPVLLLACLALALLAPTPASAATPAYVAPQAVSIRFSDSAATLTWDAVPDSQGYAVVIRPAGGHGPYGEEQVLANRYTVPFTSFPGYGKFTGGYAYEVCSIALGGSRGCTTMDSPFFVHSEGGGTSTSNLHKATAKISSCLGKGEEAGLVFAAGKGVQAAVASWIPGIDAVTLGGVAAVAAGAGATRFAACLTGW
ncbi:MAG TPA: hypothetical protein VHC18_16305 [Amycolatopsis sp.]|nr:hypothetical protein [Amycolatopsis sp.]